MTDMTNTTIEYYNEHAGEFFDGTVNADMSEILKRFEKLLPEGGCVLDAGCGSGRDSKHFLEQGFKVSAFDASPEIARLDSEYVGIDVKCCTFEEFHETERYDGIWACASLLHVRERDIEAVMGNLAQALKPGGVIYISFKYGEGERQRGERFFLDMDEDGIARIVGGAGLEMVSTFVTGDVRDGRDSEKWMNCIAIRRVSTREIGWWG